MKQQDQEIGIDRLFFFYIVNYVIRKYAIY